MGWRLGLSRSLTVAIALCLVGCGRATKSDEAEPAEATPISSVAAVPSSAVAPPGSVVAPSTEDDDTWEGHPPHPPLPPPPGASATALRSEFRSRLTAVHVSARVGGVILRKRDAGWVAAGDGGCPVPARRIERAFDNLARLKAVKTDERPASGDTFELQIVALMGEEVALQLEVAGRTEKGDLVQLFGDTRVRMRGLDRTLWSPRRADWCKEP